MKYKLIKTYPGSPELGVIIERDSNCSNYYYRLINGISNTFTPKNMENQPEFWEEIVEKDYEILEIQGKYGSISSYKEQYDSDLKDKSIYKIKRLSDNEIFTVGNEVTSLTCGVPNKILSIEVIYNEIRIYPRNSFFKLKDIRKAKQKLFTTEDGVDIFEGDEFQVVDIQSYTTWQSGSIKTKANQVHERLKCFSTKEKAEEYISINKPCLSIKDVRDCINKTEIDIDNEHELNYQLLKLVKQKINK